MIKSVRLINFGAIREAYFQPLEQGITGIFGSNGAGKSTILTGVLFTLFGVTPKNVTVGGLRRTGSEKEECSVSVLFTNAGQEIEIIKEITGSKNTVRARLFVDGVEQTVDSVKAAESWIKARLGVDAKGFTTAFVVRQKELDELVSDVPSKRKETIEKLAGVDTLKDALQQARKDENISKEVLKTVPGSQEDIERAENELLLIVKEVESFIETHNQMVIDNEKLQNQFTSTQQELTELRDTKKRFDALNAEILSVRNSIDVLESSVKAVEYVKDSTLEYDIGKLREIFNTLKAEIASKRQKHGSLQVEVASSKDKVNYVKERIAALPSLEENVPSETSDELKSKVESLFTEAQELSKKKHELEARSADVSESILQLSHSSECPTCYTPLESLGDLLGRLNGMVEAFTAEATSVSEKLQENKIKYDSANSNYEARKKHEQNMKAHSDLESELKQAVDNQMDNSEVEALETELAELAEELEKQTEAGIKAKTYLDDKAKYEQFFPQLQKAVQRLTELEIEASQVNSLIDYDRARKLEHSYPTLESSLRQSMMSMEQASTTKNNLDTRLALAESKLKSVTAQWNRKKELLLAQEKKALTREVIDKYRQETIASLTPELSEYASTLISDITTGAYDSILVDDDFNITVKNKKGIERKASELSGGEESAVALSLRLAIGALITGGNQELLWLDEILTAQDADRRASMLATIRDLSIRQIIMINHTAEAADIADRTVTVMPDLDNGSVLENADRPHEVSNWEDLADD